MEIWKQWGQFFFEVAESVGGIILTSVTVNDRTQLDLKFHFFEAEKLIAKLDGDVTDVGRQRYPSA